MKTLAYRAAGGVVLDGEDRVLMLQRWVLRDGAPAHEIRLPKGHVEPGETDAEAALREVCEESGYCGLTIIADLGELLTEFDWENAHVRRTEHYFLMRLTDPEPRAPQFDSPDSEEARFRVRWAADPSVAARKITFESEWRFVRRAQEHLADQCGK
jgi:8-oxo-dGTP pyrophosphatase MutT (NUDIX family)